MGSHGSHSPTGSKSSAQVDPVAIAVLLPHAPILVPPVGGARGNRAHATIQAMRAAARAVTHARPDALVLISPHMPRRRDAFGIHPGDRVTGSLAAFDAPEAAIDLPAAPDLRDTIVSIGSREGLGFWQPQREPLDHGAVVPLWFLAEAGWNGPTVVLGLGHDSTPSLETLGHVIVSAATHLGRQVAVIASGDMSHRLTPDAPCGHHPRAHESDEAFIRLLREGRHAEIGNMDPALLDLAAEDATESTRIAVAATGNDTSRHRVLSYEGPFGVGYGVAILCDRTASRDAAGKPHDRGHPTGDSGTELLRIARRSLEAAVKGAPHAPPDVHSGPLSSRHGVFVTLHRRTGELRGCIGTLGPRFRNVAEETWEMAREAALCDSRFLPVRPSEVDDLVIDVSVLSTPEPADSLRDLDPLHYGVIVRAADGRCGTLLPDIPDIESAGEQVSIARRKAGIGPDEPVTLQRYRVEKFTEQPDTRRDT